MSHEAIPLEVSEAYFGTAHVQASRLGGGIVNQTLLAGIPDQDLIVLQRLHDAIGVELVQDYAVVSGHLQAQGWEIPAIVPTSTGEPYIRDTSAYIWRATTYLASDTDDPDRQYRTPAEAYGTILARLHKSLAELEYQPRFIFEHFHDTDHFAQQLAEAQPGIDNDTLRELGATLLTAYQKIGPIPAVNTQLIHGDPRAGNMLFRKGQPFTFIDWDTLMIANPLVDVGDMLRSLAKNHLVAGRGDPLPFLLEAIYGYHAVAHPEQDAQEFTRRALRAAQVIALELAMRYASDDDADGFFGWDDNTYPDKPAHMAARANVQYQIAQRIQNHMETHA